MPIPVHHFTVSPVVKHVGPGAHGKGGSTGGGGNKEEALPEAGSTRIQSLSFHSTRPEAEAALASNTGGWEHLGIQSNGSRLGPANRFSVAGWQTPKPNGFGGFSNPR